MDCPKGKIMRKSYSRKTSSGKKVKVGSKCIKAQSQSGKKRSSVDKKMMALEKREHTISRQKFGTPKCKKGEIVKEGYHKKKSSRAKGAWVAPTCIKAKGSSKKRGSKGKKLFRLEKGTLGKFGYEDIKHMSKKERRESLKKAVQGMKPLSVRRKLIALRTLNKNVDPKLSNIYDEDQKYVQNTKEYKNRD
jgi:hypothetical protein